MDSMAVMPQLADTLNGDFGNDSTAVGLVSDSTEAIMPTASTATPDTLVFFRKSFTLDGKIVGGELYVTADEDYRLYLNGEYIIDDDANDYSVLDTLDYYTFDRFVKPGSNIIAIDVLDKDVTRGGLKLYGYFELVPLDLTSTAESQTVNSSTFVDQKTLKEINTLRKNRIPLSNKETK